MKKNKKTTAIIGITVVLIVVIFGVFFQNTAPKIVIEPNSFDFGTIAPELVIHTFKVKNTGGSDLEILRVSTSCGCTKATIDAKVIPPGQSRDMVVTFDPNAMGERVVGEAIRVVYIKTNDPQVPELDVSLKAFVEQG